MNGYSQTIFTSMFLSLVMEAFVLCVFINLQVLSELDLSNSASPYMRDNSYTTLYMLSPISPPCSNRTDSALLFESNRQETTSHLIPTHEIDLTPIPDRIFSYSSSCNLSPRFTSILRTSVLDSPFDTIQVVSQGNPWWESWALSEPLLQLVNASARIENKISLLISKFSSYKFSKSQRIADV